MKVEENGKLKVNKDKLKELIFFNQMYFREELSGKDEDSLLNVMNKLYRKCFGLDNLSWARNIINGITMKNDKEPNETYFKVFELLGCELY